MREKERERDRTWSYTLRKNFKR